MVEKVKINFWLEPSIKARWDEYCKEQDLTLTTLIKNSVHAYLKNEKMDETTILMKDLKDVDEQKEKLVAERDATITQLAERTERMEELLKTLTTNVTPSTEASAKVYALILKAPYASKEIASLFDMDNLQVLAILEKLKERKMAFQNGEMEWMGNKQ